MKIILITQARIGSTRLPRKVLKEVLGVPLLQIHLERIKRAKLLDKIVVATTHETDSHLIEAIANTVGAEVFNGSTDDVLDRYYQAAKPYDPDYVVRVTSDCPLIDPELIDEVIKMAIENQLDYCSNVLQPDFPDGQDIEVIRFEALATAWREAKLTSEREHVTPFIRKHCDFNNGSLFKAADYVAPQDYNHVRMTVDEQEDFDTIAWLIEELGAEKSWLEYTLHMLNNPEKVLNAKKIRNEGYLKSLQKDK